MNKLDFDIIAMMRKTPMPVSQIMAEFDLNRRQVEEKLKKFRKNGYNIDAVSTKIGINNRKVLVYGFVAEKIKFGKKIPKRLKVKLPDRPLKWFDCLTVGGGYGTSL